MKPRTLCAAIAAAAAVTISVTAHSAANSNITNAQVHTGGGPLVPDEGPIPLGTCPPPMVGVPKFTIVMAPPPVININGAWCIEPGPGGSIPTFPLVVAFNDLTGSYIGGVGTIFTTGTIDVSIQTTSGWVPYTSVDAAVTNIPCINNDVGFRGLDVNGDRINTTFGLHPPPSGVTSPFPGLTTGAVGDPGSNDAVCTVDLFGQRFALFLEGTLTSP